MHLLRKLVIIINLAVAFPLQVFADMTPADRGSLNQILTTFRAHQNSQNLLKAMKNKLPAEGYESLEANLKILGKKSVPKITVDGDVLNFEADGHLLPMKIISILDETYSINGKTVNLSKAANMAERWKLILDVLPEESPRHTSKVEILYSTAMAEDDAPSLLRLALPAGIGTSVMVMTVGGLKSRWAWAIMFVSLGLWDAGICEDIAKQRDTCVFERKVMEERLEQLKIPYRELAAKKKTASCKENKTITDERFFGKLKSLVHGSDEDSRIVATCVGERKKELQNCTKEYSLAGYYLCYFFPPSLTGYLEPWAKKAMDTTAAPSMRAP